MSFILQCGLGFSTAHTGFSFSFEYTFGSAFSTSSPAREAADEVELYRKVVLFITALSPLAQTCISWTRRLPPIVDVLLSLLGLAASLILVSLLYQRFVFKNESKRQKREEPPKGASV